MVLRRWTAHGLGVHALALGLALGCSAQQGTVNGPTSDGGTALDAVDAPTETGTPTLDGSEPDEAADLDALTRSDGTVPTADAGTRADTGSTGFPPMLPDTVAFTGELPSEAGRHGVQLMVDGFTRDVEVYVPATRGAHPPLLVMFHGTNEDGPTMMDNSNVQGVADTQGFIAVAPTAQDLDVGDWDHTDGARYWETYPATNPQQNPDLLLVRAILVAAIRAYGVDPDRVYALGHSSGGFFTILTAMALRDRIAAFAENSSGLVRCATTLDCGFQAPGGPDTCAAIRSMPGWCGCTGTEKPVPIPTTGRQPAAYMGHGTADPLVSVYYTCQLEARLQGLGFTTETHLRIGDGHALPETFVMDAWPFLASHHRM